MTTQAIAIESPLQLIQTQRSHVLLVLSHPEETCGARFLEWYRGAYYRAISGTSGVLRANHFERHEVDIDQGQHPPIPFQYLGFYEITVDGAEAASDLIHKIRALHAREPTALPPATWLYYPACEKVGRAATHFPSMLTLAFANPLPGRESEFREWYATRHIRHALKIPALVSGQCLERTIFQSPGALDARFKTIAVYEQEGTPESILASFRALPESTFDFPAMDASESRFSEWVYRPV